MKTSLFSNKSLEIKEGTLHTPTRKRGCPSWLLPGAMLLAFVAVFAVAFADRLLPAREVMDSPAILLSDIEQEESAPSFPDSKDTEEQRKTAGARVDYSAPMLFQAAGWFEPDPLPIRATALVDGVVDEVFVLEGETVEKNQPLANLISEDTKLTLDASMRKLEQTVAEHHMHLAHIPAVKAEAASVLEQIRSAEARLAELVDKFSRISGLSKGTVPEQDITAARWPWKPRKQRSLH